MTEWQAIEYVLDPGNPGDSESGMWGVTLAWRGPDQWGVYRGCYGHPLHFCYGADGDLEMEPCREDRTKKWLATHRFTLDDAMTLGERVLPTIVVNGMSWDQVEAWRAAGHPRNHRGGPLVPPAASKKADS